jgi:hypothetical protein
MSARLSLPVRWKYHLEKGLPLLAGSETYGNRVLIGLPLCDVLVFHRKHGGEGTRNLLKRMAIDAIKCVINLECIR